MVAPIWGSSLFYCAQTSLFALKASFDYLFGIKKFLAMSAGAVGIFFYKPWIAASNFCADRLLIPLIEKIRPFANSILGRIATCAVSESVCGMVGSLGGGVVVGALCREGVSRLVPAASVLGVVCSVIKDKKAFLGISALGLICHSPLFSNEERMSAYDFIGRWVGSAIGTIIGGYAGIILAGGKVSLIDRLRPADCYAVGMGKFIIIGEIFDAAIVKPSMPFAAPFLKIPRHLAKAALQTTCYNSQMIIPFVQKCFRERRLASTIPVVLKMICNRYCVDNSFEIAGGLTKWVTPRILPALLSKGLSLLNQSVVVPSLSSSIEFLGNNTDLFATIAMRSLHQYTAVLKKIDRSNIKASLKNEIPGAALVSPIFDAAMKGKVSEWADSLIEGVRTAEKDLTGTQFLGEEQIADLKRTFAIYLKYYLIYTVINCKSLTEELTLIEERDFFVDLNSVFFAIYTDASSSMPLARCFRKTSEFAIRSLYKLRRFFEEGEQESFVAERITVIGDFYKAAPAKNIVVAIEDDYCELPNT